MVKSRIYPDKINYNETKGMNEEDVGFESSMYDYTLYDTPVEIAIGNPRHEYSKYNIVYFPVYLVYDDEPVSKIGVYEIESSQMLNTFDENDDMQLDEENLIVYVSERYFQKLQKQYRIQKEFEPSEKSSLEQIQKSSEKETKETEKETEKERQEKDIFRIEIPEEKQSQMIKKADEKTKIGVFIDDPNINLPATLEEETSEISEEFNKEFNENAKNNWVENFMKNNHYQLIDNEGGGDCFFAVVRDAFSQIGKITTVDKLRAILSKEATKELFEEYRKLYIGFSAEYQDKEKELNEMKKNTEILKKRLKSSNDKNENAKILEEAKQLVEKYNVVLADKKQTKELLDEFIYMKDILSLEDFRKFIMTSSYWADTWAISTLEKVLNIKIIILSKEAFSSGDLDSVLKCGQLNDEELQKKGNYNPEHYIIASYTGNHYVLVSYKNKKILKFIEIPFGIKCLLINKCMEKNAGPYYLIEDMRKFKMKLGLDPDEGCRTNTNEEEDEYLNRDLYDKDVVFTFYSKSDGNKKAGKGSNEEIPKEKAIEFNELNKIKDWRRKLDDTWETPFTVDGHRWNTVEHYFLGSQYKKGFPDFYLQFSLDSKSDISKDLAMANDAVSKSGKSGDKVLRDKNIVMDPDFYEIKTDPRNVEERRIALRAKFTQNFDLKHLLLETKNAKLLHFVRRKEPEVDELLMKLRKELRK
jgi:hypothetical protein